MSVAASVAVRAALDEVRRHVRLRRTEASAGGDAHLRPRRRLPGPPRRHGSSRLARRAVAVAPRPAWPFFVTGRRHVPADVQRAAAAFPPPRYADWRSWCEPGGTSRVTEAGGMPVDAPGGARRPGCPAALEPAMTAGGTTTRTGSAARCAPRLASALDAAPGSCPGGAGDQSGLGRLLRRLGLRRGRHARRAPRRGLRCWWSRAFAAAPAGRGAAGGRRSSACGGPLTLRSRGTPRPCRARAPWASWWTRCSSAGRTC